jgi:hypothetical protein
MPLTTIRGFVVVELHGPDGELKYRHSTCNLVTQVGDQYYGERAAGIGSLAVATGMQLGTGTTAVAKTGAGAAIVTLVASSLVAIGTPTSSLSGSSRRITYSTTWAAGTATATGIAEVALVNQSTGTQTAAPAANTISRALLSPTVNKGASDSLTITWQHDLLGS